VRHRNWPAIVFVAVVLCYIYMPIIVIVLFSFTISPRLSLPIEGFTLAWYAKAFSNPLLFEAFINSLSLALVSALFSSVLSTAFALGIVKINSLKTRKVLLAAGLMPALVPILVIGIAIAVFFRILDVSQGLFNAAVGHVLICLPYVMLTIYARMESFDLQILDAARDLGASPISVFSNITFPLIRSSIIGATLLAAALSLDEFVVTWFNIGTEQTLPVLIWGLMRRGIDPSINAISTAMLLVLIGLTVLSHWVVRRRD